MKFLNYTQTNKFFSKNIGENCTKLNIFASTKITDKAMLFLTLHNFIEAFSFIPIQKMDKLTIPALSFLILSPLGEIG